MTADTMDAVGADYVRYDSGLIVRWEEDRLPVPCIAQNKVAERKLNALLVAEFNRGWLDGFKAGATFAGAAVLLVAVLAWAIHGGL